MHLEDSGCPLYKTAADRVRKLHDLIEAIDDDDDDDADDDNLDVAFDFLKYPVAMLHDENEVIEVMKVRKLS